MPQFLAVSLIPKSPKELSPRRKKSPRGYRRNPRESPRLRSRWWRLRCRRPTGRTSASKRPGVSLEREVGNAENRGTVNKQKIHTWKKNMMGDAGKQWKIRDVQGRRWNVKEHEGRRRRIIAKMKMKGNEKSMKESEVWKKQMKEPHKK